MEKQFIIIKQKFIFICLKQTLPQLARVYNACDISTGTRCKRAPAGENIHNTKNLIKLPHGSGKIHNKISGYYSSKDPIAGGLTIREWLKSKNYDFQYEFGIQKLKDFGWNP